jgi:FliI/YscN family ATPase
VGKSTLLGTMTKHTAADVTVVCLVGERGRELNDFLHHNLDEKSRAKSVVVCATGDEPAMMRIRCALVATTVAEYFRDLGMNVLLIMDSVTRFCHAQRQIGLAAGEPPATKGYPPSVFAMLAPLMERCGKTSLGSITGLYAVLVDGEDLSDPVAEAARSILDGHIVLSRSLASKNHYPAIDLLESISRCCDDVTDRDQQTARREVLRLLHAYRQVEDLLNIGAYAAGSNGEFDAAIACKPAIDSLVQQGKGDSDTGDFQRTRKQLIALNMHIQSARQQLSKNSRSGNMNPQNAQRN